MSRSSPPRKPHHGSCPSSPRHVEPIVTQTRKLDCVFSDGIESDHAFRVTFCLKDLDVRIKSLRGREDIRFVLLFHRAPKIQLRNLLGMIPKRIPFRIVLAEMDNQAILAFWFP